MGEWDEWFARQVDPEFDLSRPGIYQWQIEGVGTYIGKSKRLGARFGEYPNNVRKIARGLPYRKPRPDGFRTIHRELAAARERGLRVVFSIVENCDLADLNAREAHWISLRGTLNR